MKNKNLVTPAVLAGCLLALAASARAEDWPPWGGNDPGRNMVSSAKGLPETFEPGKFKQGTDNVDMTTTKNVKWVSKLGSQSYGNVTVSRGKVFVGTKRKPA